VKFSLSPVQKLCTRGKNSPGHVLDWVLPVLIRTYCERLSSHIRRVSAAGYESTERSVSTSLCANRRAEQTNTFTSSTISRHPPKRSMLMASLWTISLVYHQENSIPVSGFWISLLGPGLMTSRQILPVLPEYYATGLLSDYPVSSPEEMIPCLEDIRRSVRRLEFGSTANLDWDGRLVWEIGIMDTRFNMGQFS